MILSSHATILLSLVTILMGFPTQCMSRRVSYKCIVCTCLCVHRHVFKVDAMLLWGKVHTSSFTSFKIFQYACVAWFALPLSNKYHSIMWKETILGVYMPGSCKCSKLETLGDQMSLRKSMYVTVLVGINLLI